MALSWVRRDFMLQIARRMTTGLVIQAGAGYLLEALKFWWS